MNSNLTAKFENFLIKNRNRVFYILIKNWKIPYSDAEDIFQEASIKAYLNLKKFDETRKFDPWFNQIINHLCIDYFRIKKKELPLIKDIAIREKNRLELQDSKTLLYSQLSKLPKVYKQTLILQLKGLDYDEIKALLKVSKSTIRWRLFYARKLLRQFLIKKGYLDITYC